MIKRRFKKGKSREIAMKQKQTLPYNDDWKTCSPEAIRGHIVNIHLRAKSAAEFGVARFDIEVAARRKFDLGWVVRKAYGRLERSHNDIRTEIIQTVCPAYSVDMYRTVLVKTLKFIAQLGLADVDWSRVKKTVPNADEITLDINRDANDESLADYLSRYNQEQVA